MGRRQADDDDGAAPPPTPRSSSKNDDSKGVVREEVANNDNDSSMMNSARVRKKLAEGNQQRRLETEKSKAAAGKGEKNTKLELAPATAAVVDGSFDPSSSPSRTKGLKEDGSSSKKRPAGAAAVGAVHVDGINDNNDSQVINLSSPPVLGGTTSGSSYDHDHNDDEIIQFGNVDDTSGDGNSPDEKEEESVIIDAEVTPITLPSGGDAIHINNPESNMERGEATTTTTITDPTSTTKKPSSEVERNQNQEPRTFYANKKLYLWIGMAILICIIILVIVLVVFIAGEKTTKAPTFAPTTAQPSSAPSDFPTMPPSTSPSFIPTDVPSASPSSLEELAITILSSYLPDLASPETTSRAQQDALEWLIENDDRLLSTLASSSSVPIEDGGGDEDGEYGIFGRLLLERFVMAVLYLSTNWTGWTSEELWMSEFSVCIWEFVSCQLDGKVDALELGKISWRKLLGVCICCPFHFQHLLTWL